MEIGQFLEFLHSLVFKLARKSLKILLKLERKRKINAHPKWIKFIVADGRGRSADHMLFHT